MSQTECMSQAFVKLMLCLLADIHANANGVEPATPVLLLLYPECECSSALSVEPGKWVHEHIIESS